MLAFAGQAALRVEPVELPAVLEELRTALPREPPGAGAGAVALEIAVPPGLPPVAADRAQLGLALLDLAVNARDAMPGGGRLSIEAAAEPTSPADPRGLAPRGHVRITVRDTGTGMDGATLARATEPFFTTKEVGKGSGLGLSMAHGFATQSGGALRLESRPGEGTAVRIWLPAAAPAPAPPAGGAGPQEAPAAAPSPP
jgi:signal transduction histidine kinase